MPHPAAVRTRLGTDAKVYIATVTLMREAHSDALPFALHRGVFRAKR